MARAKNPQKKPSMVKTMVDAYKISKDSYPWLPWALLLAGLVGLGIGLGLGFATKRWVIWGILGVMLMILFPMMLLTQFVRKASYKQIEGMPGATSAVLDSLRGSWVKNNEPVRMNPRQEAFLFRIVGRPGIVLVAEGPLNAAQKLVADERKALRRLSSNAPIHVIYMGNGEGQIPLPKIEKTIKSYKNEISSAEVSALAERVRVLGTNAMALPKGIDPNNLRAGRRSMR